MKIRAYEATDRNAVVGLHQELQAYESAFRPTRALDRNVSEKQVLEYERMLAGQDDDAFLLVADDGAAIIGFAFFIFEGEILENTPRQAYIQDIMVTAQKRRLGVGRSLMSAIRNIMEKRGVTRIDLQVLVGNDSALAFYRQFGFETAYLGLKAEAPSFS